MSVVLYGYVLQRTGLYTADGCGLLSKAVTPRWNRAELCYNCTTLATS
eukprot:COSAG01_NODE_8458_length_2779_cov_6.544128_2_plen_48_part_00